MNEQRQELDFDNENNKDYYDIVINLESLKGLKEGYEIEFTEKGFTQYKEKKTNKCCVVGVVGNRNKGKSYILSKLSGITIPIGHTITTKGLSVNFPKEKNSKSGVVLIDTAGLETPLLKTETQIQDETKINLIARDKQLTELFLQRFVIAKSNILLAVVGPLTLSDQKLLHRITNDWKKSRLKRLLVVHNLMNYEKISQVNSYIEEVLMQSYTFKLEDLETFSMPSLTSNEIEVDKSKMIIYQERVKNYENEDETIIHLIMAQEGSEAGDHYNNKTLSYIQKQVISNPNNREFDLLEEMRKFFVSQGKDFYESPKLEEKHIEINEKQIKLKADVNDEVVLKRCMVDELGVSNFYSRIFTPKYRCFRRKKELFFEIDIHEKIKDMKITINSSCEGNLFYIRGNKQSAFLEGSKDIIHDSIEGGEFSIEINIPLDRVQLKNKKSVFSRNEGGKILISYEIQERDDEYVYNEA